MIILRAEQLTKEFTSGQGFITVLDDINIAIKKGERLAIMGPSGSGKSTLLGILSGLDSPTRGQVLLEGTDLATLDEDALSAIRGKRMGFIFQSYHLLPTLTAEENVSVPLELAGSVDAGEKAKEWLEKVGLGHRLNHMPAQLSGGEQQRVALARALAPSPDLLFADEPTGNLDSRTGSEMTELIFSLVKESGATLVLVTHENSIAKLADRIIELLDGRIVNEK